MPDYFRFCPTAWMRGGIQFVSLAAKGLFIDLCAMHWSRGCGLTMVQAQARFGGEYFDELLAAGLLTEQDGMLVIGWLAEERSRTRRLSDKRAAAAYARHKPSTGIVPAEDDLFAEEPYRPSPRGRKLGLADLRIEVPKIRAGGGESDAWLALLDRHPYGAVRDAAKSVAEGLTERGHRVWPESVAEFLATHTWKPSEEDIANGCI